MIIQPSVMDPVTIYITDKGHAYSVDGETYYNSRTSINGAHYGFTVIIHRDDDGVYKEETYSTQCRVTDLEFVLEEGSPVGVKVREENKHPAKWQIDEKGNIISVATFRVADRRVGDFLRAAGGQGDIETVQAENQAFIDYVAPENQELKLRAC